MEMFIKGMYIVHYNKNPYDSSVTGLLELINSSSSSVGEVGEEENKEKKSFS